MTEIQYRGSDPIAYVLQRCNGSVMGSDPLRKGGMENEKDNCDVGMRVCAALFLW